MKLNRKRVLTGLVATGVLGGALAGGGVALASTGSSASSPASPSSAAATAAPAAPASTPAATAPAPSAAPTAPASGRCDGGTAMRGPGGMGGPDGLWAGQPAEKAAAAYLGISQDQLRSQLQSGKSLAAVATAKGKPVSGLKNALITAMSSQVNADTRLSAAQKAEMISEIKSHIDSVVNATRPSGFGMRGMGSPAGDTGDTGGMGGMGAM